MEEAAGPGWVVVDRTMLPIMRTWIVERRGAPILGKALNRGELQLTSTAQLVRHEPRGLRNDGMRLGPKLLFPGLPWCQLRSWLFCCSGSVAFVVSPVAGWLNVLECSLWLNLELSCRYCGVVSGRYFVARWNVGVQAGCVDAGFG